MLTLYYKPTCPYCQKVLAAGEQHALQFDLRDISSNEAYADELIEKGGKRQVPYLIDSDNEKALYESDDIVAYLNNLQMEAYGKEDAPKSEGGGTCTVE